MKKLFLTAVAVVAFGFVGNANYKTFESKIVLDDINQCLEFSNLVYYGSRRRGLSHEEASILSDWAFNDCQNWE
ncbi:MAG: hypothetical protein CVU07_05490 [Bacteroidetes bacterium HGW-Bacteroidetes-23]|nr:MAG: hypothetical protein CVU07_05490 [Bacteroidetes bacterium HGW-Bacteroidetes-23]